MNGDVIVSNIWFDLSPHTVIACFPKVDCQPASGYNSKYKNRVEARPYFGRKDNVWQLLLLHQTAFKYSLVSKLVTDMKKRWDIIGLGALTVDDLFYIDHYPRLNEKLPVKMTQRHGGGLAATALVAAARQGAKSAYCGRLGDDELSIYSLQELEREGVDTALIQHWKGAKPYHSIILVEIPSGSRVILYNSEGVVEPDSSLVTEELIANTRVLFIDNTVYESGVLAAIYARAHGIPVVADIESIDMPDLGKFLSLIDHLIVGIDAARNITHKETVEEMVQELSKAQRAASVVTDGVNGCWVSEYGKAIQHFPAYQVEVVDTTGCGDVFHGAYAAALVRGESIGKSIQVASASAAIKATCFGGREGIPNLNKVEEFIKLNER
jgi:sugar/nucleoside kinase (ribokinase family)